MAHLRLAITQNAQLDLCILRTFQSVHGFLIGDLLASEGLVVYLNDFVASNNSSTLGRTLTDNLLDM